MHTGPKVTNDGLIFAVDPASNRGTYMQDIVNNSAVTTVGTPTTSSEGFKTVTFDGDTESYNYGTSNIVRGLSDLTMMGWVKQPSTSSPHQTVFCTSVSYRHGLKLMSRYHGQWAVWIGTEGSSDQLKGSGHDISGDDIFYLIGCTRRGSTGDIILYEDGEVKQTYTDVTIKGSLTESGVTGYGVDYHSNGYRHHGKLGQVWVWDKVLTAQEMANMYNVTKTRYKG